MITVSGMIRPPRLRRGMRVALISPAGPIADERVTIALERCADLGLDPVLGRHARCRFAGYLAGSDEERLADLQWALASPDIDAVWALRGGYGTMRLLERVSLAQLRAAPRAYIGFSDNTALHLALHARGLVSFHAPHAGSDMTPLAQRCLERVLWHADAAGLLELPPDRPPTTLHGGMVEGPLVGGNLAMLAALAGSPAALRARAAILFLEDVGEASYRLDRAWVQLSMSGALDGVAGIIFGRFTDCGGSELPGLLRAFAAERAVPAVSDLPIGHEADNWTLPLGVQARLDADAGTLTLLEPAVS
ncbi:MAG TPA: LD-carboxypeptidase [Longimicrobiales bacterium]|nr:LD-carboxypeptidase [Longimicrobiales bacterium]